MSAYEYLIKAKANPRKEYQVFLFTHCNLRCSFCFFSKEQLADISGVKAIISQAFTLVGDIQKRVAEGHKLFQINIMGGELFQDFLEDSTFKDYAEYCRIINKSFPDLDIEFVFITNLIFSKTERVLELVRSLRAEGVNVRLGTSFDFAGRFSKMNKALFMKNLSAFPREILNSVSIVLTKQNIQKLVAGSDVEFRELYDLGYEIVFDSYSPDTTKASDLQCPTDLDVYEALVYLREFFPNTQPVKDMVEKEENYMTCRQSIAVSEKTGCGGCKNLVSCKKDFSYEQVESNADIEEDFLKKFNCASCEFFRKCTLGCFLQNSYIKYGKMDECLYKKFFREYVE